MATANTPEEAQAPGPTACDIDTIPPTLGVQELAFWLDVSETLIRDFQRQGRLDRFKLQNPIGRKKYSGALVRAYLRGGGK